jgi:hypothetical protein
MIVLYTVLSAVALVRDVIYRCHLHGVFPVHFKLKELKKLAESSGLDDFTIFYNESFVII